MVADARWPNRALRCLLAVALVQLVISALLYRYGVDMEASGIGGVLLGLHAPGRVALCSGLGLCEGYGHFLLSDVWGPGPQHPIVRDLILVGATNALLIGALALLVCHVVAARSTGPVTKQSAV